MSQNEPDSYRVAISVQGLKKSYKNIVKILTTLLKRFFLTDAADRRSFHIFGGYAPQARHSHEPCGKTAAHFPRRTDHRA
jgi:hypothetical protein